MSATMQVESMIAGHTQAAAHKQLRILAEEMKRFHSQDLAVHCENNGGIVLQLDVSDVQRDRSRLTVNQQIARASGGTTNFHGAFDGRMPRKHCRHVAAQQRIDIEVGELSADV